VRWGVVAAVAPELRATLRVLRARRRLAGGRTVYEAGPLVFASGGVGAARAARCAGDLLERFRIDTLVSTGFAAALLRDLRTGDLLVGGTVGFPAAEGPLRRACTADPGARTGEILAVQRVLLEGHEKESAARTSAALAVDMESAAVGRLARDRGLAFLCVKAVLDTPDAPLASRYDSAPRVLGEILRRPTVLSGIFADASRARRAGQRLADFYEALAATLH
jgi:adenosylhomocysteine nucleosidase